MNRVAALTEVSLNPLRLFRPLRPRSPPLPAHPAKAKIYDSHGLNEQPHMIVRVDIIRVRSIRPVIELTSYVTHSHALAMEQFEGAFRKWRPNNRGLGHALA